MIGLMLFLAAWWLVEAAFPVRVDRPVPPQKRTSTVGQPIPPARTHEKTVSALKAENEELKLRIWLDMAAVSGTDAAALSEMYWGKAPEEPQL